ncbi:TetR family transcriptional regulator [bacterium]|nr:MAG: TetR family transcriptional regulator [bacterium]
MSTLPDRRTRKRLATRQAISDAATRLFFERGFEQVTIDEIAEAADVGRMTVYKHFSRKEDMFFDLDEAIREDLVATIRQHDSSLSLIETLRLFAHRAIAEQNPYVRFFPGSQYFMETIRASETLKARARAIRDELAQMVATALSESVGRCPDDADAHLTASLLVATWSVAFLQAHRTYQSLQDAEAAQEVFLGLIDKGTLGLKAMMAETPYA